MCLVVSGAVYGEVYVYGVFLCTLFERCCSTEKFTEKFVSCGGRYTGFICIYLGAGTLGFTGSLFTHLLHFHCHLTHCSLTGLIKYKILKRAMWLAQQSRAIQFRRFRVQWRRSRAPPGSFEGFEYSGGAAELRHSRSRSPNAVLAQQSCRVQALRVRGVRVQWWRGRAAPVEFEDFECSECRVTAAGRCQW